MAGITQYQPYGIPGIVRSFIAKAEAAGFIATFPASVLDQYRFPQIPYSFDDELRAFLLDLQRCLSVPLTGDSFPGGIISPVDIITKTPKVDVRAFGADSTGAADSTAAFTKAINYASNTKLVYVPIGDFLITDSLPKIRYIRGENMWKSRINFLPTGANKVLFDASPDDITGGALYWQADISNLSIYGGNAIDKTAIKLWHVRGGFINRVQVHFDTGVGDTSTGSIALNIMGCDEMTLSNVIFRAARPILAENQPTSPRNHLDHITFDNMTLYNLIGSHPLIEFQIKYSQIFFAGRQTWVGGTSAFYASGLLGSNLTFENLRWEPGGVVPTEHIIYITGPDTGDTPPDKSSGVTIRNSRIGIYGNRTGIYLRYLHSVLLEDVQGSWSAGAGNRYLYDVDGTVVNLTAINVNTDIGDIDPNIGSDLTLVLSIGGDTDLSAVPKTRYYTSEKAWTGGVYGKPYVSVMGSLFWSDEFLAASGATTYKITAEVKEYISYAIIQVNCIDPADITVRGFGEYEVIMDGVGADVVNLLRVEENGITFDTGGVPVADKVGVTTSGSIIYFRNRQDETGTPLDLTTKIRVIYHRRSEIM